MLLKNVVFLVLVGLTFDLTPTLNIKAIYSTDDGLPDNNVRIVYNDPDGIMWAGTGSGPATLSTLEWKPDTESENPITSGVSSIYKDTKANHWFGGFGMAHRYNGASYESYSILNDMGLNGRVVFSFHEDEDKNIWVATTGGVAIFDGSNWNTMTMENGLSNNVVHDIDQDKNGNYWFATRKGGLNIFDGSEWKYLYPNKNCRKIFRDREDNMWVGTSDGIIKYDSVKWQVFEEGKTILPMFQGHKGLIWSTIDGTGIIRISSEGKTILYEDATNNKANEIYHLEYDKNGSVWAGTDQGVFVFH